MRDDRELAIGVEDDGDRFEERGSDGPAAAEELDGVVGRAAALEVDGEVQIAERGRWRGLELGAVLIKGELSDRVGDEAYGDTRPSSLNHLSGQFSNSTQPLVPERVFITGGGMNGEGVKG